MPRRRLKSKTRRLSPADLTQADLLYLRFGYTFPRYRESDPTHGSQLDEQQAKRLIEDHRDELLERLARPGHRPWVWWAHVASRPRCSETPEVEQLRTMRALTDVERRSFDEIREQQLQRLAVTGHGTVAPPATS